VKAVSKFFYLIEQNNYVTKGIALIIFLKVKISKSKIPSFKK
jgi:hypothetical protein